MVPVKTDSLSRAIFEITGLKNIEITTLTFGDVIDDVIIRSAIGHFLLVGNWYQVSTLNCFRDICI